MDESIDSLESLEFGHPESNGDSEPNISRGIELPPWVKKYRISGVVDPRR